MGVPLEEETKFWNFVLKGEGGDHNYPDFMKGALQPLEENKKQKSQALRTLRTQVFLLFLFVNAGWSFTIFWLQQAFEKDGSFGVDWPLCPALSPSVASSNPSSFYQLDPINVVFIFLFILLSSIQLLGMLSHRLRTLTQWMASS